MVMESWMNARRNHGRDDGLNDGGSVMVRMMGGVPK
jgi:hypothetical protein